MLSNGDGTELTDSGGTPYKSGLSLKSKISLRTNLDRVVFRKAKREKSVERKTLQWMCASVQ